MYKISIPLFIRGLENLSALLDKAEGFVKEQNFKVENLLMARLYPDMFNMTQQVQYAYYHALDLAEKLSGRKDFQMSYKETTVDELQKSIADVLIFLGSIQPEEIDGTEEKLIAHYGDKTKQMPAFPYMTQVSLPNFYFHIATAYNILRHNGVSLGKADYIGRESEDWKQ